jgi:hypothetical protein
VALAQDSPRHRRPAAVPCRPFASGLSGVILMHRRA